MKLFGFEISFTKVVPRTLETVSPGSGGWMPLIREPYTGAWQRNEEIRADTVLGHPTMFRCISLIAGDIAKLKLLLVEQNANGIWDEVNNPAFSPVLRKPNRYQNRVQFISNWMESKLIHGNAYILKGRDARNVVTSLTVLDPTLVSVLVAEDGSVWYELRSDRLAHIPDETITIPASEIIHDRYNATWNHPLIGISPIRAAAVAATQGLKIQNQSTEFFAGSSTPSALLVAPGNISNEKAEEFARRWDEKFGPNGTRRGYVAVMGGDMKYTPLTMSAVDAQLIEQLRWSSETVCGVFGVPRHKVGIGDPPISNNVEALNFQYYSDCIQIQMVAIESCLDEGLGLGPAFGNKYGVAFDLEDLLLMDSKTKMEVVSAGVQRAIYSPNEARFRFGLGPVDGGESPYVQEQNWPLRHMAERPLPTRQITPPAETEETPSDGDSADAADRDEPEERGANIAHIQHRLLRRAAVLERAS